VVGWRCQRGAHDRGYFLVRQVVLAWEMMSTVTARRANGGCALQSTSQSTSSNATRGCPLSDRSSHAISTLTHCHPQAQAQPPLNQPHHHDPHRPPKRPHPPRSPHIGTQAPLPDQLGARLDRSTTSGGTTTAGAAPITVPPSQSLLEAV
jgi:hypothetical protein